MKALRPALLSLVLSLLLTACGSGLPTVTNGDTGEKKAPEVVKSPFSDTDDPAVLQAAELGFVSGICAGNYDVTDIFVDSTLKITGTGAEVCDRLVSGFKKLSASADTNIVLSISAAEEDIPAGVADCVLK